MGTKSDKTYEMPGTASIRPGITKQDMASHSGVTVPYSASKDQSLPKLEEKRHILNKIE